MALIQALIAALLRQSGRLLNTVFGWATTLLFGRLPEDRQIYLSLTGLGAVLWVIVLLGVAFPRLGTFLLAFVPFSAQLDPGWVRLGMLAAVVLLPLGVGVLSLFLVDPEDRPRGKDRVVAILKGYPYTLGLAVTLLLVLFIAPVTKLVELSRGWTSAHIPVLVEPDDYLSVVGEVERIVAEGGVRTSRRPAHWALRLPTRIFSALSGGAGAGLVAREMTVLDGEDVEVLLHPSDLVVRGKEKRVNHVRALLAEHLVFTPTYLTWTKEANEFEDRLGDLWREVQRRESEPDVDRLLVHIAALDRDLRQSSLSFEEWEVLLRERLLLERTLFRRAAGLEPVPSPEALPPHTRKGRSRARERA